MAGNLSPVWYQRRPGPSCRHVHRRSYSIVESDPQELRKTLSSPDPVISFWRDFPKQDICQKEITPPDFHAKKSHTPWNYAICNFYSLLIKYQCQHSHRHYVLTSGAQAGIKPPALSPGTPSRPPAMIIVGVLRVRPWLAEQWKSYDKFEKWKSKWPKRRIEDGLLQKIGLKRRDNDENLKWRGWGGVMQKVGTSPKGSTPSTGESRSIACNCNWISS